MVKVDAFGNIYANIMSDWMLKYHPAPPIFNKVSDFIIDEEMKDMVLKSIGETLKTGKPRRVKCEINFAGYRGNRIVRILPENSNKCILFFQTSGDFIYHRTPMNHAVKA